MGMATGEWTTTYAIFMAKRFFRIVPIYLLYIFASSILIIAIGQLGALRDLPFLTFTYNWQRIFQYWPNPTHWSGFEHLWTISTEEQFYILFPLLFLSLPRKRYIAVIVSLVALGPLVRYIYSAWLTTQSTDGEWLAFAVFSSSFAHFDAFLLGAVVAQFRKTIKTIPEFPNSHRHHNGGAPYRI